jgi:hypothetical protein
MKIYFIGAHNQPSGGTKVINQMVNLCLEKSIKSSLVINEKTVYKAKFLASPAPTITIKQLAKICKREDIVINCWQQKISHEVVSNCSAQQKIFWSHGASIPTYPDFNGEEVFKTNVYNQHWNVSKACANYIQRKYHLKKISILHPFFDDETLLKYKKMTNNDRQGFLITSRRGQDIIPYIIQKFPRQKFTILPNGFTDEQLYQELIKHKFFISLDTGIGHFRLSDQFQKSFVENIYFNIDKLKKVFRNQSTNKFNNWIVPDGGLLGFPMTACEAAWLGTIAIGFAMGGGLEWMRNDNMYLAKNKDLDSLINKITEATNNDASYNFKRQKAFKSVSKFSKSNCWTRLNKLLKL